MKLLAFETSSNVEIQRFRLTFLTVLDVWWTLKQRYVEWMMKTYFFARWCVSISVEHFLLCCFGYPEALDISENSPQQPQLSYSIPGIHRSEEKRRNRRFLIARNLFVAVWWNSVVNNYDILDWISLPSRAL